MKKLFIFLFLAIILIAANAIFFIKDSHQTEKTASTTTKKVVAKVTMEPQNVKIAAFGDSLTEGVGDSTEKGGYLPYLQSLLEQEKAINKTIFDNFGKKGIQSDQLLNYIQTPEAISAIRDADIVIITIGGNDMMNVVRKNLTSLEKTDFEGQKQIFEDNLSSAVAYIKQINNTGQVILIGLYNPFHKWFPDITEMDEVVSEWNNDSQEILSQYPKTSFIDIMDIFKNEEDNLLYTDYFHPNNRGYELIAGKVFEEISDKGIDKLVEQKWIVQNRGKAD